jgi:hypothetical protein
MSVLLQYRQNLSSWYFEFVVSWIWWGKTYWYCGVIYLHTQRERERERETRETAVLWSSFVHMEFFLIKKLHKDISLSFCFSRYGIWLSVDFKSN